MVDLLSNANIQDAEKPEDYGKDELGKVRRWFAELKSYEEDYKTWIDRAAKMWAIYGGEAEKANERDYNLLWANTRILRPVVYGGTPVPRVQRRHKDKNAEARAAAEILERGTKFSVDNYDFDGPQKGARDDWLIAGRGTVWVRYVPDFESEVVRRNVRLQEVPFQEPETFQDPVMPQDESGEPIPQFDVYDAETDEQLDYGLSDVRFDGDQAYVEETEETLLYSEVLCEHVSYKNFFHEPAACWEDVSWVAKRVTLTREKAETFFGKDKAAKLKYESRLAITDDRGEELEGQANLYGKAEVFEIWYKPERKVYWVSTSYAEGFLKEEDDPLGLKDFFPCPKPLFANTTADSLVPQPDYFYYQPHAECIAKQTRRIRGVVKAIKPIGGYDDDQELGNILETEDDCVLRPIKDFDELAERGGIKGAIDWVDNQPMAAVLSTLYESRAVEKSEVDDLYGITDLMRGATDPGETYGAQRMKQSNSDLRISEMQQEMARHARDTIAIMAEIIAEKFEPDVLRQMTGTDFIDGELLSSAAEVDPEAGEPLGDGFEEIVALLRNDMLRSFAIDIETDSTIATNDEQEKAVRLEIAEALGSLMTNMSQIVTEVPAAAELFAQVVGFVARAYKGGRELEPALDAAVEGFIEAMNEPEDSEQEQPDPEMMKIQLEQQKAQADFQLKSMELQSRQQAEQMKMQAAQHKAQMEGLELEVKAQEVANETQKVQLEAVRVQLEAEKHALEVKKQEFEQQKTMIEHVDRQAELEKDYYEANLDAQIERESNATRLQDEMIESRAQMAEADAIKSIAVSNKQGQPVTVNVSKS